MSEYKGIKGFQVQTRTEDPTPYAQALADNPYVGVWASGGSLNTARTGVGGGAVGTQTASITGGGNTSGATAVSEQYNGTSWTETNDLNIARYDFQKFGTSTAALHCGGEGLSSPPYPQTTAALVESWNGSSWTETTDMPAAKRNGGGAGTSTSGLVYGGNATPAAPRTAASYEWDGSSWTAGGDMNTTRRYFGSYGTQTAAQAVSGDTPPYATQVEQYNGSSWTEIAEINTARAAVAGNGTTTSALVYGGNNGSIRAFTESWDGSSWTEVADLATAVQYHGSGGANNLSGLSFGGGTPSNTSATEEWSFSGVQPTDAASYADAITGDFYYNSTTGQFKTVNTGGAPIGTWASGGAMNTSRNSGGAAGIQSAAMIAGGANPGTSYLTNHEQYNGTSWTETTDLSTARRYPGGGGTQTANLIMGGSIPPGDSSSNAVEQWDGSSWTEIAEMNQGRRLGRSSTSGTTTAMLLFQGSDPGPGGLGITNVELWNGSSWTELNEMNTLREGSGSNGVSTTAIAGGGLRGSGSGGTSPYAPSNFVESWDGTSWTEVSEVNTSRSYVGGGGTSNTAAFIWGGGQPVPSNGAKTEAWNGSAWTEINDLAEGRDSYSNGSGSTTDALNAGGYDGSSPVTTTEEWTAADFQIKSVTTS